MSVLLIIKSPHDEQTEINLATTELPLTFGRSGGGADIQLDDPQLSREHCEIVLNNKKLEVLDLCSSNGTWVNGNDLDKCFLKDGDVVRIGGSTIDVNALHNKQNDPLLGQQIGGYIVKAVVGRGSFATVFRGIQINLDRPVALKIMHADKGQQQQHIDSFMREAREAGRLNNPHVVQAHDVIQHEDLHILVMELMEGASALEQLQRNGPFSYEAVLTVMQHIGQALSYAESHKLVHRDVKPANILQTNGGIYKLADLGIATRINSDGTMQDKTLTGTPLYMAPEQARGEQIDTRADIYGLGATVWHLLTGDPMYSGSSREVIAAHINRDIPELSELAPGLNPELAALIISMVSKNPDGRPRSGNEVAERAAAFVGQAGTLPEPGTRRKRTRGIRRSGPRRSGRRRVRRRK